MTISNRLFNYKLNINDSLKLFCDYISNSKNNNEFNINNIDQNNIITFRNIFINTNPTYGCYFHFHTVK